MGKKRITLDSEKDLREMTRLPDILKEAPTKDRVMLS